MGETGASGDTTTNPATESCPKCDRETGASGDTTANPTEWVDPVGGQVSENYFQELLEKLGYIHDKQQRKVAEDGIQELERLIELKEKQAEKSEVGQTLEMF